MPVSGPVDVLALTFPSSVVDPAVVSSVADAVARGDVRVLDLLVVQRDADGTVQVDDLDDELERHGLERLVPEGGLLVSDDDVETVADALEPGRTGVIIVYEHLWAVRVREAVVDAGGEVALHVHHPVDVVRAAVAADELSGTP
jgi:hypothetical protein